MSFGNRRLDEAYDKWITQTPEKYYGEDENKEKEITEDDIRSEINRGIDYANPDSAGKGINKLIFFKMFKVKEKVLKVLENYRKEPVRDIDEDSIKPIMEIFEKDGNK